MDLKETLRDALCKCDEFKVMATQSVGWEQQLFDAVHHHYEGICRLLVQHDNHHARERE